MNAQSRSVHQVTGLSHSGFCLSVSRLPWTILGLLGGRAFDTNLRLLCVCQGTVSTCWDRSRSPWQAHCSRIRLPSAPSAASASTWSGWAASLKPPLIASRSASSQCSCNRNSRSASMSIIFATPPHVMLFHVTSMCMSVQHLR